MMIKILTGTFDFGSPFSALLFDVSNEGGIVPASRGKIQS